MKSLISILIISTVCFQVSAQESLEKIMESRAKEMMRVIALNDSDQWKNFIKSNCTQAFIDRNMKAKVVRPDGKDDPSTQETKTISNLEAKTAMFERLHNDFGDGKITSLKTTSNKIDMIVDAAELKGTFRLTFETTKPYLIEGLGIEAGN